METIIMKVQVVAAVLVWVLNVYVIIRLVRKSK
jgi:hypothetical protein